MHPFCRTSYICHDGLKIFRCVKRPRKQTAPEAWALICNFFILLMKLFILEHLSPELPIPLELLMDLVANCTAKVFRVTPAAAPRVTVPPSAFARASGAPTGPAPSPTVWPAFADTSLISSSYHDAGPGPA